MINKLINFASHNVSWIVNSLSARQGIVCIVWYLNVRYLVHKCPELDLGQMNSVHTPLHYLFGVPVTDILSYVRYSYVCQVIVLFRLSHKSSVCTSLSWITHTSDFNSYFEAGLHFYLSLALQANYCNFVTFSLPKSPIALTRYIQSTL
jgi:hypothetical protein